MVNIYIIVNIFTHNNANVMSLFIRMYSGCRQLDVEQFIEAFDPDIVDISLHTLNYLQIHMKLKVRDILYLYIHKDVLIYDSDT